MRKQLFVLTTALAASLSLHNASAEETPKTVTSEGSWYAGGGYLNLDSEVTGPQGVGSGGFSLEGGYAGSLSNGLIYNVGIYLPFFSDKDSFSQRVRDQYGNESTKDSSIFSWGLLADIGYRYENGGRVSYGLSAGLRTLSADRDIGNCSNCYSEDIDLSGGPYLRPSILIENLNFDIEISALLFMSGDIENGFMVNFLF